jgi:hypothetical protein
MYMYIYEANTLLLLLHRNGIMPRLAVLIRDFDLDLPPDIKDADGYLESMLRPDAITGDEDEDTVQELMNSNRAKKAIVESFPNRGCYTLPHPLMGAGSMGALRDLGSEHCKISVEFMRRARAVVSVSLEGRACIVVPIVTLISSQ